MSTGFEVKKTKGGKVAVILHPKCKIAKSAILELLAKAGIRQEDVIFVRPEDVGSLGEIADLRILIPIDEVVCSDEALVAVGRQCAGGTISARVIVLIGPGFEYQKLHPIAEGYGTQCDWSAERLKECLDASVTPEPRRSDGATISRPRGKQVDCN